MVTESICSWLDGSCPDIGILRNLVERVCFSFIPIQLFLLLLRYIQILTISNSNKALKKKFVFLREMLTYSPLSIQSVLSTEKIRLSS